MLDQSCEGGLEHEPVPPSTDDGPGRLGTILLISAVDQTVLELAGDVDLSMSGDLDDACREAIARDRPIRLDVSGVTFIDSTAIGHVVRLAAAERDAGRALVVAGADRRTAETFRLTGLGHLLGLD